MKINAITKAAPGALKIAEEKLIGILKLVPVKEGEQAVFYAFEKNQKLYISVCVYDSDNLFVRRQHIDIERSRVMEMKLLDILGIFIKQLSPAISSMLNFMGIDITDALSSADKTLIDVLKPHREGEAMFPVFILTPIDSFLNAVLFMSDSDFNLIRQKKFTIEGKERNSLKLSEFLLNELNNLKL